MDSNANRPLVEKTPIPLTDGQINALGKVTAEWSMAESILEHFLWVLIPTDQKSGRALTTHMSSDLRCDAIRLLCQDLPEVLKASAMQLITRFEKLRKQRNNLVHNSWAGEPSDKAVAHKPSVRGGEFRLNTSYWSESDILMVHTEISEWIVDAVNYLNQKLWWPPYDRLLFQQLTAEALARKSNDPSST
jgi:hypothetical protein